MSLGTAQLGMAYGIANEGGRLSDREAQALLAKALELGIDKLDTAPAYGLAEQRIGRFHAARGPRFTVSSKLAPLGRVADAEVAREVERQVLRSLKRLRVDSLDVCYIHDLADLRSHGERLAEALEAARERGLLERAGVSVYGPEDTALAMAFPGLAAIQHPFNLLDRRLQEQGWDRTLANQGCEVHVRSVLLQGLLALEPAALPAAVRHAREPLTRLRRLLGPYGFTPVDVALPFALAVHAARVIVAADNARQLEHLVGSIGTPLPRDLPLRLALGLGDVAARVIDPRAWCLRAAPQSTSRQAAATVSITRSTS